MKRHYQVLIIGGGTAGITVSAQLRRRNPRLDIAIVEPSDKHYYQPGWTLVGGGVFNSSQTVRNESDYIPQGVTWIRDSALQFDPDNNSVVTGSGEQVMYDFLVVCCGVQLDWHLVKGLPETIGKNGVCSNYLFQTAPYTYECIRNFQEGEHCSRSREVDQVRSCSAEDHVPAADNFRRRVFPAIGSFVLTGKPASPGT
jgi:sulfide:quinone oxidoreductase